MLHDVTPVARRVADRQKDRLVLARAPARTPRRPTDTSPPGCARAAAGRDSARARGDSSSPILRRRWRLRQPRLAESPAGHRRMLRRRRLQARVRRRHLDAVQQNHRRDVDPEQEHHHRGDRAVDDVPRREVARVPRERRQRAAPQQPGQDRARPDLAEPHLGVGDEVEQQARRSRSAAPSRRSRRSPALSHTSHGDRSRRRPRTSWSARPAPGSPG